MARSHRRLVWSSVLAVVTVGAAACKAPSPTAPRTVATVALQPRPVLGAAAKEAALAAQDLSPEQRAAAQRLEALRCDEADCCATAVWPLGLDKRGRRLAVIALESTEPCLLPQRPSKQRAPTDEEEEPEEAQSRHACSEHWLVDVDGAKPPIQVSLAQQCGGDHSETHAAVDLEHRTLIYGENSVYSADRTWDETVVGLDPLRLVETSHRSERGTLRDQRWNWDELAGELELGINYCDGRTPPDAEASKEDDEPPLKARAVVIPQAALPAAFADDGWRRTALGRCAAVVDGERGFVLRGGQGAPGDSTLRVLFGSRDVLFVEVTDDRFVAGAKTWVQGDHLELWAVPSAPECVDPTAKSPALQWGIRLSDGEAFPGFGAPLVKPAVEVARAGSTVRLKITFEGATLAGKPFSVVYSDSDDGVHQKRLIATSDLHYGKWWTLGETSDDENPLSCTIERGALTVRRPPFPGE